MLLSKFLASHEEKSARDYKEVKSKRPLLLAVTITNCGLLHAIVTSTIFRIIKKRRSNNTPTLV
jgi:hypothetical protein